MLERERPLLAADLLIGAFEHREIEVFLVTDVVIQHALVGAGLDCNAVDPRTGKAMGGKFLLRRLEDTKPHTLGIALPFQNPLCLFFCQPLRLVMVRDGMYHATGGSVHGGPMKASGVDEF